MPDSHLLQAIQTCNAGGVIAYPTEAVFGLGCLPFEEVPVRRILKLKQRSSKKGLIVIASEIKQLEKFVDFQQLSQDSLDSIHETWPGHVTWLVPAKINIPEWLKGEHKTLAVRVSAQPVVRLLCEKLGPIVSTSANPQGQTPARDDAQVKEYFKQEIDYVMPGLIDSETKPSEIRDAISGRIIRNG